MKKLTLTIATVAVAAALTGCTTMQRLGITEDIVATGVQQYLDKEGLAGTVTDAQIKEVVAIVKAETRLQQIAEDVGQQAAVQAKIEELVKRYLAKE
jgi:predicted small secreted protein